MSRANRVLSKLHGKSQAHHKRGFGAQLPAAERFFVIAFLRPFGCHYASFQSHLKQQNSQHFSKYY